jgi:hypothetical protein
MSDPGRSHEPGANAVEHPAAARRLSWLSAALAVILTVEMIGLSWYAISVFRRETQPEKLAERAEKALIENYPSLRRQLLEQTSQQAPVLAKEMSNELLQASLEARVELEAFTLAQLERGLDNAVELSADEFREFLKRNHDTLEDAFQQIEQAPNDARLLVLDTEASLEEQLGLDVRDQAKLALEVYRLFNDKLARLASAAPDLSQQERLERRMIRLLRAMSTASPPDDLRRQTETRRAEARSAKAVSVER